MNPAFSVIVLTIASGAAQGLVFTLALAVLAGAAPSAGFLSLALSVAVLLLLAGLGASFLHLGRPERAWRAAMMWRTSWLSREVIVLPAFTAVVALWWLALRAGAPAPWLPLMASLLAVALWVCTAMIYACLRFIEEWAQPWTLVNFTLTGLSSGLVLACALAAPAGEVALLARAGPWALAATLSAWGTRLLSLRHNARLRHRSTLQSATGIRSSKLVQTSMGMSAGSFNTREFFHGRTAVLLRNVQLGFHVLAFALPSALLAWGSLSIQGASAGSAAGSVLPWALALVIQAPGLLAERWFFFAQARHPQNLYYQVVS